MTAYAPHPYPVQTMIQSRDHYASHAKDWHEQANMIASWNPKLAARCRDVARSLSDLAFLLGELKRERE